MRSMVSKIRQELLSTRLDQIGDEISVISMIRQIVSEILDQIQITLHVQDKIKILAFIVKTSCSENVYASATVYEFLFITWKSLQRNDFAEKALVK